MPLEKLCEADTRTVNFGPELIKIPNTNYKVLANNTASIQTDPRHTSYMSARPKPAIYIIHTHLTVPNLTAFCPTFHLLFVFLSCDSRHLKKKLSQNPKKYVDFVELWLIHTYF